MAVHLMQYKFCIYCDIASNDFLYTVNGHQKQVIEQCREVVVLVIDSLIISDNKLKAGRVSVRLYALLHCYPVSMLLAFCDSLYL
jgi:hypothetical protein